LEKFSSHVRIMDRSTQEKKRKTVSIEVDAISSASEHLMQYPEHDNSFGAQKAGIPFAHAGLYRNKGKDPV